MSVADVVLQNRAPASSLPACPQRVYCSCQLILFCILGAKASYELALSTDLPTCASDRRLLFIQHETTGNGSAVVVDGT